MAGNIFVISAPSGTGKTTIVKKLLDNVSKLSLAVSCSTREQRPGEKEGIDYFFVNKEKFESMADFGQFVEWAEVHGYWYGTLKSEIDKNLKSGINVLLDVDTQGAARVKQKYPDAVSIFLLPPSFDELERRLRLRGVNTDKDLERRISNARKELSSRHEYDYQIVNEKLDEAYEEVLEIINHYTKE